MLLTTAHSSDPILRHDRIYEHVFTLLLAHWLGSDFTSEELSELVLDVLIKRT